MEEQVTLETLAQQVTLETLVPMGSVVPVVMLGMEELLEIRVMQVLPVTLALMEVPVMAVQEVMEELVVVVVHMLKPVGAEMLDPQVQVETPEGLVQPVLFQMVVRGVPLETFTEDPVVREEMRLIQVLLEELEEVEAVVWVAVLAEILA